MSAFLALIALALNPFVRDGFSLEKPRVLLFGAVVLVAAYGAWRTRWRDPLIVAGLLVVVSYAAAAAFSVNLESSLGAVLMALALFGVILAGRKCTEQYWRSLVWASVPACAYALLQASGHDPLVWLVNTALHGNLRWESFPGHALAEGTFGNPLPMASWLIMAVPFTVAYAWQHRTEQLGVIVGGILLLQAICLALAQERGPVIALAAAGALWALTLLPRGLAAIFALVALVVGAALAGIVVSARPATVAVRLKVWQESVPLIEARPWLGYGPATYADVFRTVDPSPNGPISVDYAHDGALDALEGRGLFGLLADVALVLAAAWSYWKYRAIGGMAVAVALLAHLLDSFVSPPDPAVQANTWALLGLL